VTQIAKHTRGGYIARPIIDGHKLTIRATTKREVERQVAEAKKKQQLRRLGLPDPEERRPEMSYDTLCEKVLEQYPHREQSKRAMRANLARGRDTFGRVLLRELTAESIAP
jgi:hypothetical protein